MQDFREQLTTLEINDPHFFNLSTHEQKKLITKAYRKLAKVYHPDKNKLIDNDKIATLNDAYKTLIEELSKEQLNQAIPFTPIDIPQYAFNQKLQIQILQHYETLIDSFNNLTTENEKEAFLKQHQNFLNIGKQLSTDETRHNQERLDYYTQTIINNHVLSKLLFDLRTLIIKTYGQENLDDFAYRNAIITGDVYNILDTIKLLSPLKFISFLLSSVKIIICDVSQFIGNFIIFDLFSQFERIYYSNNVELLEMAFFITKSITLIGIFTLCTLYFLNAFVYMFSFMFIANLMEYIANPMNRVIRPLADYLNTSDEMIMFALAGCFLVLLPAVFLLLQASLIGILNLILSLYILYALAELCYNIYNIDKAMGIFFIGINLLSFAMTFLLATVVPVETTPSMIFATLENLFAASVLFESNQYIKYQNYYTGIQMETMAYPQKPLDSEMENIIKHEVKTSNLSHFYFHTREELNDDELNNDELAFAIQ